MSVSMDELDIGGIGIASSALGLAIFSAIGVLFGSYPAAKASRMPPIDALQRR